MADFLLDLLTYIGGFLFMVAIVAFSIWRALRATANGGSRPVPRPELRGPTMPPLGQFGGFQDP